MPFGSHDPRGRRDDRRPHPHPLLPRRPRAWPACAASAWSRSRGSARCRRPAPTRSPRRSRSTPTRRKVRQARRHVLDLLLSEHYGDCYSCVRNGNCELQALAEEYGVDYFRFGHPESPRSEIDDSSYSVVRDMNKCILCRRCVRTCIDLQEVGVLEAVDRGDQTEIATFVDKPLADVVCINCGQCINRCPTGRPARQGRDRRGVGRHRRPRQARRHPDGARRRARPWASASACEPGTPVTFEMNTALRRARLRQGVRHQLHRRPDDHRGGHRADPAALQGAGREGRERRPAAVHQLLAGLGQVPRALLPRVPAQRLVGQEPAADVRRADQDLLRREARASTRRTSSAWR